MHNTVYSTKEFERPYIKQANRLQYNFPFTHQAFNEEAVVPAGSRNAIIVFPADDLSPPVIDKPIKTENLIAALKQCNIGHVRPEVCENKNESLIDEQLVCLLVNPDVLIRPPVIYYRGGALQYE